MFSRLGKHAKANHQLVLRNDFYEEFLDGQLVNCGCWHTGGEYQPILFYQASEFHSDELPFRLRERLFEIDGDVLRFYETNQARQPGSRALPKADKSIVYEFHREVAQ